MTWHNIFMMHKHWSLTIFGIPPSRTLMCVICLMNYLWYLNWWWIYIKNDWIKFYLDTLNVLGKLYNMFSFSCLLIFVIFTCAQYYLLWFTNCYNNKEFSLYFHLFFIHMGKYLLWSYEASINNFLCNTCDCNWITRRNFIIEENKL